MYSILTLNKIAAVGTDKFDSSKYTVGEEVSNPDAIMVRSAKMHDMEFGSNLLAIARAGAGVNNIPVDKCAESGIVVFNSPGANANAVKELAICALLLSSRKITEAAAWAASLRVLLTLQRQLKAVSLNLQVLKSLQDFGCYWSGSNWRKNLQTRC